MGHTIVAANGDTTREIIKPSINKKLMDFSKHLIQRLNTNLIGLHLPICIIGLAFS
jgi:hypothetical protein